MKKFLATRSREDGFTLIELLVVVIIIAILAAIAVPVYIGIQNNAKKSSIQSDVATTKLNVAAFLAEDGKLADLPATAIQNSKSPSTETVTVTAVGTDGNYQVVGTTSDGQFGNYSVTYNSTTGQQTAE